MIVDEEFDVKLEITSLKKETLKGLQKERLRLIDEIDECTLLCKWSELTKLEDRLSQVEEEIEIIRKKNKNLSN